MVLSPCLQFCSLREKEIIRLWNEKKQTWCLSSLRTSSKSAATSFFWELLVLSIKVELGIGSTCTLLVMRLRLIPTVGRLANKKEARMRRGRESILNLTETSSNLFCQFCVAFDLCHPFSEVAMWGNIPVIAVKFIFPKRRRQKYTSKNIPPQKAGMMTDLVNPRLW